MASDNSTLLRSPCASFDSEPLNTADACFYFLLFPIAFVLNGIAAWVSFHLQSTSTFIVYLKNLVAADFLMTLTLPPMAASKLPGATVWLMAFDCRFSSVFFYSCLYTCITLMGLISLDRFFKIVRPFGKAPGQSVTFSVVTSCLVWLVLFAGTAIPTMILTNKRPVNATSQSCMSLKSPTGVAFHSYVVFSMELLFWIVSILIVSCYACITMKVLQSFRNSGSNNSQGRKRTKLRVFLILLVFFVCFVPLHIVRIPPTIYHIFQIHSCMDSWVTIGHKFCRWLSSTNACLDPLLYIYLCREYRDKLLEMMRARGICVRLYSGEKEEDSQ